MYVCDLPAVSPCHTGKLGLAQSRKAVSRLTAGRKNPGLASDPTDVNFTLPPAGG